MSIYEPATNELEHPDAEPNGMEQCRFYCTEVDEVDGRVLVTGVDLDTFEIRSFFVDQMQHLTQM